MFVLFFVKIHTLLLWIEFEWILVSESLYCCTQVIVFPLLCTKCHAVIEHKDYYSEILTKDSSSYQCKESNINYLELLGLIYKNKKDVRVVHCAFLLQGFFAGFVWHGVWVNVRDLRLWGFRTNIIKAAVKLQLKTCFGATSRLGKKQREPDRLR